MEAVFVNGGENFFGHIERHIDADGLVLGFGADHANVQPTVGSL
jgi:hypothetical protein